MFLSGISLQQFRNYRQQTILFSSPITIIIGENAQGKTSIIEAINLLATGDSFRATEVEEMIQFGAELARVKGKITDAEEHELEVMITRGQLQGKRVQGRVYSVNNVRRRKKDFLNHLYTVAFRPEDMRLIEGSPSRRRQYIDTVLTVLDREYAASHKTYEETLKRRNKLLQQVREGEAPRSTLTYWTNALVKHGSILQEKRRQFFAFFPSVEFPMPFSVEYTPSVISEERIQEYADREIAAGHTLIGPHKDDFVVSLPLQGQVVSIALYGSRGQQRLAVLWLKVVEMQYMWHEAETRPLLLLDDILSELDETHRHHVMSLLHEGQSIVTTTEERMVQEILETYLDTKVVRLEQIKI